MKKTKAAFRAIREECGMTQHDIAAAFGKDVRSVKRWENPETEGYEPPEDVWGWLLRVRAAMHEDARELAEQIIGSCADVRGAHGLTLDYYRTQGDLDAVQLSAGIDEPVGYYNARQRLIGRLLEQKEIPYTFAYPDADR